MDGEPKTARVWPFIEMGTRGWRGGEPSLGKEESRAFVLDMLGRRCLSDLQVGKLSGQENKPGAWETGPGCTLDTEMGLQATGTPQGGGVRVFIAALFKTARKRKEPKHSSRNEWINKMGSHTTEYYSSIKRNDAPICAALWTSLENTVLNERSQTQKGTYYMTPSIWKVLSGQTPRDRKCMSDGQGLGQEGKAQGLLMGLEFLSTVMKMF